MISLNIKFIIQVFLLKINSKNYMEKYGNIQYINGFYCFIYIVLQDGFGNHAMFLH